MAHIARELLRRGAGRIPIYQSLDAAEYKTQRLLKFTSEGAREIGLLWIVFANLEPLISGRPLTFSWLLDHSDWFIGHTSLGALLWLTGTLLEVKPVKP